ncbi:MAG TPA: hypothetical protein VK177_21105 [Flavobacteriales bacterium]|nr:hypothetical protein [Flavobacteriales bacterium]
MGQPLIAQKKGYTNEQEKLSIIEQRVEFFAENSGQEDPDLNALFDRLLHYIDHPLDLNNATKTDLAELSLLNEVQVDELLRHIERTGKLLTIYEIQALPSWDMITIEQVLPFVYVTDRFEQAHITLDQLINESTNELYVRYARVLETQKGYQPNLATGAPPTYLGSNDRVYTRYRFKSGNYLSVGLTAEKDAGEEFFKGTQKNGFDFYSGHVFVRDIGVVKHFVVGDYFAAFGQGLTMGMGPAFGKTAASMTAKRVAYKLKPYTSVDENVFLRGAATTIKLKNVETTVFYSSKKIDANVTAVDTSQGTDDNVIATSFQTTGSHATVNELADKHSIKETIGGAHFSYGKRTFEIGGTFYGVNYGGTLDRDLSFYNQYAFTGKNNYVAGIDYTAIARNLHFFGETSMSKNKGLGSLNGVILGLDPKLGMVIMHRYYQRNFQNLYSNAFAESSTPVNENGLYMGVEMKPNARWVINGYADLFQSSWLKFQVDAPSRGNECLAQVTWKPNKQTQIYVRYKNRNREINTSIDLDDIDYTVNQNQANYRFDLTHKIGKNFSLHTRIEQTTIKREDQENTNGYLAFQDLFYKPMMSPFSFNIRYAIFDTDDYNARVYAYESDVLYYYYIPSYYYKGSRIYGNIRFQYKKWLDVWLKVAQWLYDNRTTVGSGNDEIQGNKKTEVRVQVRISF